MCQADEATRCPKRKLMCRNFPRSTTPDSPQSSQVPEQFSERNAQSLSQHLYDLQARLFFGGFNARNIGLPDADLVRQVALEHVLFKAQLANPCSKPFPDLCGHSLNIKGRMSKRNLL